MPFLLEQSRWNAKTHLWSAIWLRSIGEFIVTVKLPRHAVSAQRYVPAGLIE
jgi:hypothetical protein